ncbi:MAG: sigma-54-dependent Fis family transcriptional regulator [Rhodobacteraceae bacterium]|nr:sigma-54-dependent Fis family transcriptional regulator [Paracoccaceae bacterium]
MFPGYKVAIIDDEKDIRESISQWLTLTGYETDVFPDADSALKIIGNGYPGVVISDIRMPGLDGMELLQRLTRLDPEIPVILITGHGDVPMAVHAMRIGAYDFLEKPFEPEKISKLTLSAMKLRQTSLELVKFKKDFSGINKDLTKLIGVSRVWKRITEKLIEVGSANRHLLIKGETGVGKTMLAHTFSGANPRSYKDPLVVSCNIFLSPEVVDNASFLSLVNEKLLLIESAHGGDLILEDIEKLPNQFQDWLLKFLNDQIGSGTRIISIDNSISKDGESTKTLRKDLYFRLADLIIDIPPLRERPEDTLALFNHYLSLYSSEYGLQEIQLTTDDVFKISKFPWPGNIRQLNSVVEKFVSGNRRGYVSLSSILIDDNSKLISHYNEEGRPLKEYVDSFEKMLITNAMQRYQGSISLVMKELKLPRRTLNEKMAKYNLQRSDYI